MTKRVRLLISGMVQGVFYRASAARTARGYQLSGFVQNLADGSVEVIAQGEQSALTAFIQWCSKGPSGARVDRVEVAWCNSGNEFNSFEIH